MLLMDEPCSALDPQSTLRIEDLIQELKDRVTIVIVTHNMQQAARVSDTTAFFTITNEGEPGRLIEVGSDRGDLLDPEGTPDRGLRLGPLRLIRARAGRPASRSPRLPRMSSVSRSIGLGLGFAAQLAEADAFEQQHDEAGDDADDDLGELEHDRERDRLGGRDAVGGRQRHDRGSLEDHQVAGQQAGTPGRG